MKLRQAVVITISDIGILLISGLILLSSLYFYIDAAGIYNEAATLVKDHCAISPNNEYHFIPLPEGGDIYGYKEHTTTENTN